MAALRAAARSSHCCFSCGRAAAFFAGVGHGEQAAVVETVRGERLEQHAIGNPHAVGIRRVGDVMEERLPAIKAVARVEPRRIEHSEKMLAVFEHPFPIGHCRPEREEIVRRPEPDHIIGGPGVGVGLVFRHDLLVGFGDHLPRGVDLFDHVRRRNLVAQSLSDFPRQLERRQHLVRIKPIHAQHAGNGNVARVNPVTIARAGTEIDHARLMLHLIALHVVEGNLPHAFGERRDVACSVAPDTWAPAREAAPAKKRRWHRARHRPS